MSLAAASSSSDEAPERSVMLGAPTKHAVGPPLLLVGDNHKLKPPKASELETNHRPPVREGNEKRMPAF